MFSYFFKRWGRKDSHSEIDLDSKSFENEVKKIEILGFWSLGVGFFGFLVWAALAPLGEGVPTQGVVAIADKSKVIQHLQSGIVSELLVHEGQFVKTGDVLIRLDSTMVRGSYETLRQEYFSLRAIEGRLIAEQIGSSVLNFDDELLDNAKIDPLIKQHIIIQEQLLRSRRDALNSTIAAHKAQISGLEAQIESYGEMLKSRENQLSMLNQQLSGIRDLVSENYAPRNQQLELERQISEILGSISSTQGQKASAFQTITQLRQQIITVQNDFRKEVDTTMQDVRRQVEGVGERFRAAREELSRMDIRAPTSGYVVGLSIHTIGGVIQSGEQLMTIVPEGEPLMLETKVAPHLIDRVHVDDIVDVRFSAFSHTPSLLVEGKLASISADVLTDPSNKTPYYLARIKITEAGMDKLGNHQMQPGMPVEVVIKTGQRTLLAYLIHPLTKRIAAAMQEE